MKIPILDWDFWELMPAAASAVGGCAGNAATGRSTVPDCAGRRRGPVPLGHGPTGLDQSKDRGVVAHTVGRPTSGQPVEDRPGSGASPRTCQRRRGPCGSDGIHQTHGHAQMEVPDHGHVPRGEHVHRQHDLAGPSSTTPSGGHLQAVPGSEVPGATDRRRRAVPDSSSTGDGVVWGREESAPGVRSDATGLTAEEGPVRDNAPRRPASWHHDVRRCAGVLTRSGDRPMRSAAWSAEFLNCLRTLNKAFPGDRPLPVIMDNDGTHQHENVRTWFTRHPRFVPQVAQIVFERHAIASGSTADRVGFPARLNFGAQSRFSRARTNFQPGTDNYISYTVSRRNRIMMLSLCKHSHPTPLLTLSTTPGHHDDQAHGVIQQNPIVYDWSLQRFQREWNYAATSMSKIRRAYNFTAL